MIFTEPLPFSEALQAQQVRTVLPTEFRTFLLGLIPADLRRRAFFSAGVMNAELLDDWHGLVGGILDGELDRATARLRMKELLQAQGYQPPLFERGGLVDLSSDARTNLILDMNTSQARNYGDYVQGQDEDILDLWPAQELFRAIAAREPRDWPARWRNRGGRLFGGRMIALKNDPLWRRISRFGQAWPPFDFNSGMRVRDVEREEAEDLGLIAPGEPAPAPQIDDLNEALQARPEVRSAALRAELEGIGLGRFDDQGVFRLNRETVS